MTRRDVLAAFGGAALARAAAAPFRLAVCNETFQGAGFAEQCRLARKTGYTGIEIVPSTLVPDAGRIIDGEGLRFAGFHNLLSAPAGLHATSPDREVFDRTWDHMRRLAELCGGLGGGVMVLGSGKQRSGTSDAVARLEEGLARVAKDAEASRATILLEPLAPQFSNVVNTLEEAVAIVKRVGSPAVQSIFDVHNTVAERLPHAELIARYSAYIRHVHLNEMDGRHPGTGSYDFVPVLKALAERQYKGWLSLEVFDFTAGGESIAAASGAFMRAQFAKLG